MGPMILFTILIAGEIDVQNSFSSEKFQREMLYCRRVKPIGTNGQRILLVLQCWNKKLLLPWFSFSHLKSLRVKSCTADAGSQLGAMGQTNAFYCTFHTSLVKLGTTTTPVCASTKKYKKRENMYYCRYFHFRYAGYKES